MKRVFSGVQSSGAPHVGNYFGAFRQWVLDQHGADSFFCVVDLHALTIDHDPAALRTRTLETASWLFASGLDPDICTVFVQSHVHEHTQLSWLLECTATYGELQRMTQFKEKSAGSESVRAGLLTYPVLMAADILLYDTHKVPVGDDQRQHLELTRDVAIRFNGRYGETFVVPEAEVPKVAARVMDLQRPTRKMSKSVASPLGTIDLLDDPDAIRQKIRKAVTDTDGEVRYDPEHKPGLSNLIELFAASSSRTIDEVTAAYDRYGPLKSDLAENLVEVLSPVRERYAEITADPEAVPRLLEAGAEKASAVASATWSRARRAIGLLEP
jgi:tryptophanyl-tRNA synthetase